MSETILKTHNISKRYGASFALRDVSIEIRRGQIYGLIGLNGAGKTTLMRSIMGLANPTSGEVEIFGQSSEEALLKARRRIGQSIETPALYGHMTAEANLEIQRRLGGVPGKECIGSVLETVGLYGTGKKKVKDFSLGMRQRLALASALITNPEFLILDEPINGLDPRGIIEIRELMRRLAEERGITFMVSSHLLDELSQVATHYGIIDHGRIIRQLSAEELMKETRTHLRLRTSNNDLAAVCLREEFGITGFDSSPDGALLIYDGINRSADINASLNARGIAIYEMSMAESRLEDYFMTLTGGQA